MDRMVHEIQPSWTSLLLLFIWFHPELARTCCRLAGMTLSDQ